MTVNQLKDQLANVPGYFSKPTPIQLATANAAIANGHTYQEGFGPELCAWDDDKFLYLVNHEGLEYAIDADGNCW